MSNATGVTLRQSGQPGVPYGLMRNRTGVRNERRTAIWLLRAFILFVSLLPLGFVPLQAIGLGFLKPTQLAVAMVLVFAPFALRADPVTKQIVLFVVVGIALRQAVLLTSLAWSDYVMDGLTFLIVDFASAAATLIVCVLAARFSLTSLANIFVWGSVGIAISLHLVIFAGHALSGRFSPAIAVEAIASGQLKQLKAIYFTGALQGLGLQGVASFFTEVAPRSTNAFGSAIISPAIAALHLHFADRLLNKTRSSARNAAAWFAAANAFLCIIIAYSDRVTVYAGLILLTHVFYYSLAEGNRRLRFVFAYLSFMGIGALLIYLAWSIAAQDGLGEAVAKFMDNPRFNDLNRILMALDNAELYGAGMGTPLNLPGLGYKYPHNLFLSDYFFAGLLGLFAASAWLFVLIKLITQGFGRLVQTNASSAEKSLMLGATTILLYNVAITQLSAQGLFDLNDWIGMGIGLLLFIKASQLVYYGDRPNPVEFAMPAKRKRRLSRHLAP